MTIDQARLLSDPQPRYLAIADAITRDIEAGRLAPESRLPPQRELAYRLGVTVGTVSRAYQVLAQRRLVGGHVGRGTFVRARDAGARPELGPDAFIDLSKNAPPVAPSAEAMRAGFAALAAHPAPETLFDYAPTAGAPAHRRAAATWLGRVGLAPAADEVIVFGGAQQALAACLAAHAAGAGALVERLTYPGLISVSEALDIPLHAVDLDAEGMAAEDLERVAATTGAGLVALVPTLQNPMNTVMSLARREEIVAVARRRDLVIVEDDVYGFVPAERPPTLASLAPERTIYIASASKCMAPGLRLGWAVAPRPLHEGLLRALYAMSVCRPPLTAEIGRHWIESGAAARMVVAQREEAAARQALAAEILAGYALSGHPSSFHVFLRLPDAWSAEAFAAAARERGIGVVPSDAFNAGTAPSPRAVRVSLSQAPSRSSLARALGILGALAADAPRAAHGII